jgi:hypothetical protein
MHTFGCISDTLVRTCSSDTLMMAVYVAVMLQSHAGFTH